VFLALGKFWLMWAYDFVLPLIISFPLLNESLDDFLVVFKKTIKPKDGKQNQNSK
jgi:hypothetical protein